MKNLKYIIFAGLLFMLSIKSVSATDYPCQYRGTRKDGSIATATCTKYTSDMSLLGLGNNKTECNVRIKTGNEVSTKVLNLGSSVADATVGECLPYLAFCDRKTTGDRFRFSGHTTQSSALAAVVDMATTATEPDAFVFTLLDILYSDDSVSQTIQTYTETLNDLGTVFDLDRYCVKNENGQYTVDRHGYSQQLCIFHLDEAYNQINVYDAYVQDQIYGGKISSTDPLVENYRTARDKAVASLRTDSYWDNTDERLDNPDFVIVDSGSIQDVRGCDLLGGKDSKTVNLLSLIIKFIRLGVPVLIIILGTIDFLKIVFSGEDKVYKDAFSSFIKRLLIGVIIILVPYVLQFVLKLSGVSGMYGIDDFFCGIVDATSGVQPEKGTCFYCTRNVTNTSFYYWGPGRPGGPFDCVTKNASEDNCRDKCFVCKNERNGKITKVWTFTNPTTTPITCEMDLTIRKEECVDENN